MYLNAVYMVAIIIAIYYLSNYVMPYWSNNVNNNDDTNINGDTNIEGSVEKNGNQDQIQENWANYQTPYYDYALTGNDPLIYYTKPMYRRPYRYPFTFFKSYPYPHMSYYGDANGR
jgi:hypothetical protein